MNLKKIFTLFSLTLLLNHSNAQSFKQHFNDLVYKKDTVGQLQLLQKWKKTNENDPELFIAYFNYYIIKSKNEIMTLGNNPEGNNVLQILNQDTTKKDPIGFIYSTTYYSPDLLSKGLDWIAKGIEKFPDRLDMRFGQIYIFGQIEDYENFTKKIIKTINYSGVNIGKWTWTDNKPLDNPKDIFLSSIQNYQIQLYETGNDSLLDNMKSISKTVLHYFPEHIESLSNLSIVFMLTEQYEKALEQLLKAEKINPKDCIILNNIAQTYKSKGDKKNAVKYYKLTIKYGDAETIKYGEKQIEELKE